MRDLLTATIPVDTARLIVAAYILLIILAAVQSWKDSA